MEFQKYNVKKRRRKIKREKKEKTNKVTKIIKRNIYMKFALKKRVFFFCKVIVGYKSEN